MIFLNYEEAVAYIEETPKFTTKNTLEHTRECLKRLGNPQKHFRVIHVAGTNGKGSTCAFLASILRAGGYRCGLFTSPHLVKTNERFQIDEVMVDDEVFLQAFHKVKEMTDQLVKEGEYHPTYFEMLFLMGMVIFAEAGVEYVILETGLGGRLDATSAIEDPMACVITSISLDHMQYLGNTVEEIAAEKAGIIVPDIPVIYDANKKEAAEVIAQSATRQNAPAYACWQEQCEVLENTAEHIRFTLKLEHYGEMEFEIPFIARYQVMNAALALHCMDVLYDCFSISSACLLEGLRSTRWQGRMETIAPGVIVDGAHNEDGVCRFVETAAHFQQKYALTLLFSAVNDKDYREMIGDICREISFAHVVTTEVGGYREVPAEELAEIFREFGCQEVTAVKDIPEAYETALRYKGDDGLLFCVGSLYLVGEIKSCLQQYR